MRNLSFVIISFHLMITQLPRGHGGLTSRSTTPECLSCFKTAELNLFRNILTLSPKCNEAKKIIKVINGITTTHKLVKSVCKTTYSKEYNEGIKNLQTKGREAFKIFSNTCKLNLSDANKIGSVIGSLNSFGKATRACKDPNHLKAEAEAFQEKLVV